MAAQYFYEEQLHRMECLAQEPVLFEDVVCQMHDMIQPAKEGLFTLADLRRSKPLSGILFNILFNLNKFVAFETRDPFLVRQVLASTPPPPPPPPPSSSPQTASHQLRASGSQNAWQCFGSWRSTPSQGPFTFLT